MPAFSRFYVFRLQVGLVTLQARSRGSLWGTHGDVFVEPAVVAVVPGDLPLGSIFVLFRCAAVSGASLERVG